MMWCLQTIVMLNEAAQSRAKNNQSIRRAYADVKILIPNGRNVNYGTKENNKEECGRSSSE